MQPACFGSMLSCGGWVQTLIDTNPYLRHVILLGIPDEKVASIPRSMRDKVRVYTDSYLHNQAFNPEALITPEPLYISIDKDVLSPSYAATNWDQGSLSFDDLRAALTSLMNHERVIGVDVCGECPATPGVVSTPALLDDRTNRRLLALFHGQALC